MRHRDRAEWLVDGKLSTVVLSPNNADALGIEICRAQPLIGRSSYIALNETEGLSDWLNVSSSL